MLVQLAERGTPLAAKDVPAGVPFEQQPDGMLKVDPVAFAAHDPIALSADAQIITETYHDLRVACGGNGFGPSPICWAEIRAYSEVTGKRLDAWALNLLRVIDSIYLKHAIEEDAKK